MKLLPKLLAATSIFAATAAIAGPPVRGGLTKGKLKYVKPLELVVTA